MSAGDVVAAVEGLRLRPSSDPIDIEFRSGKVLGLAGLEGHGQEHLLRVLAGIDTAHEGTIAIGGNTLEKGFGRMTDAFASGVAYVPRDRKDEGLFLQLPVLTNFALPTLRRFSRRGLIQRKRVMRRYEEYVKELGITAKDEKVSVSTLSGGNQQKVLLARWLAADPRLLLLNDSSRGVDHSTKASLQKIYRRVADEGSSVVLLSTEIEELLVTADETIVFREFGVSDRLSGEKMTRQNILAAMFGAQVG